MINKKRKVSHPGKYVKDAIEALNMTQNEFAIRVGMTSKNINTLINEKSNITYEVAEKLASFFNNSIDFWTNLQNNYESYLLIEKKEKELEEDWKIVQYFDKKFLESYCNIKINKNNKEETIESLKHIFYVSSLTNLKNDDLFAFCHTRKTKIVEEKEIVLRNAWITLAMKKANDFVCNEFNEKKLDNILDQIRSLTILNPEEFTPKLASLLSNVGIKYVELPYLANSNISGVTKWNKNDNSFVLAINDYSKYADRIWFTIFHELGHIKKNNKKHMSISLYKENTIDEDEKFANDFAKNILINDEKYCSFIRRGLFDLASISAFAKEEKINRDIVIGRLEKDGCIKYGQYKKNKYNVSF